MKQKQNVGKIKKIIKYLSIFFQNINPRYQLSLDGDYYDIKEKDRKYRFKSFGEPSFPEFTFNQIKFKDDILFSINPHDVMKISAKNYIQENSKQLLRIDEFLRNNLYKMSNVEGSNIFSGDEICDNPLLIDQIVKNDLFKIAYQTGFERGRRFSKIFNDELHQNKIENNVVHLR